MNWITFEGKFATEHSEVFLDLLQQILDKTKTQFHGKIYNQIIPNIPCQKVELSTQTEVLKESGSNIKMDDSVKEEDTLLSSFEKELL